MMDEPWKDKANYTTGKVVRCHGCRKNCHRTKWGDWCYECNVDRIGRINKTFDALLSGAMENEE